MKRSLNYTLMGRRTSPYIRKRKYNSQITESMRSETVRERVLAPLRKSRDNYKKIILTTDTGLENDYEGIESLNVIDWLLDK